MLSTTSTAVLALAFIGSANAHMVMSKPQPPNFEVLANGPLGAEAKFPCHNGGNYQYDSTGEASPAAAGSPFEVQFMGSAVHGGGVCQFSVTYEDPPPADPSKWKVIHTIVGGCPAEAEGNLVQSGTDDHGHAMGPLCPEGTKSTGTECVRSFDIPIPSDLKNGRATFAWTWFNKIGNREMYMNCAPIEISGGKDDDSFFDSLPQMFVANTQSDGTCTTSNGILALPEINVGISVLDNALTTQGSLGSCTAQGSAGVSPPSGSNGNTNSPAPDDKEEPTAPVAPVPSNPGHVLAPSAAPAPPADTPANTPAPPAEAPAATPAPPAEAPVANPPVETAPAPPTTGASVPCTNDGAVVCIEGGLWGLCDHGFAVPQQLAAGMECSNGTMQAKAIRQKRHARSHLRAHARSFK